MSTCLLAVKLHAKNSQKHPISVHMETKKTSLIVVADCSPSCTVLLYAAYCVEGLVRRPRWDEAGGGEGGGEEERANSTSRRYGLSQSPPLDENAVHQRKAGGCVGRERTGVGGRTHQLMQRVDAWKPELKQMDKSQRSGPGGSTTSKLSKSHLEKVGR